METSIISSMPEGKTKEDIGRTYSNETFYTDSSEGFHSKCKSAANLLQKRRQLHPLLGTGIRNPYRAASNYGPKFIPFSSSSKTNMNTYSEKIMSAKLLRVKQLQNELTDAQFQLNELSTENRLLKTLQKRQDLALSKYEGTKAELPKLISSHNEEVRILKAKVKQLKSQSHEKDHRIKELDMDLQNLRDQHRHLLKLSRNRHLGDREQLSKQLEELQEIIKDQDIRIQTLNRKVMLESKNFKHQLSMEIAHHKETQNKLSEALDKISKLELLVETKEKYIATFVPKRYFRNNNRQSLSLVSLAGPARYPNLQGAVKSEAEAIPRLDEESSEGTYMASQNNTSAGSTNPSTDALQTVSENKIVSDGYNARRMKLTSKRNALLDKKLPDPNPDKTTDIVSNSGFSSPTPSSSSSSSLLSDDRDADLLDGDTGKQPYTFGTDYNSRRSSANTDTSRKLSSQEERRNSTGNSCDSSQKKCVRKDSLKSQSAESLEDKLKETNTYTKTSRCSSFLENEKKDIFSTVMADIRKENALRRGSLNQEFKSVGDGLRENIFSNINCSRKCSLAKDSFIEENSNFIGEESLSQIITKNSSRRASLNSENILDLGNVNGTELGTRGKEHVLSDEEPTKNSLSSERKFTDINESLPEISKTQDQIQDKVETDRELGGKTKMQHMYDTELAKIETKGYEKDKLLAALKAIDNGEEPTAINVNHESSVNLDKLLNNSVSTPSSDITLPFLREMRFSDKEWGGNSVINEISSGRVKTKDELMQELFGNSSLEHRITKHSNFTARSNN